MKIKNNWNHHLEILWTKYCWWKKSCTSWYVVYPIIYSVWHIPGGPGFLPSTVWWKKCTCWFDLVGCFESWSFEFFSHTLWLVLWGLLLVTWQRRLSESSAMSLAIIDTCDKPTDKSSCNCRETHPTPVAYHPTPVAYHPTPVAHPKIQLYTSHTQSQAVSRYPAVTSCHPSMKNRIWRQQAAMTLDFTPPDGFLMTILGLKGDESWHMANAQIRT